MGKVYGVGGNDAHYKTTKWETIDGVYTCVWECPIMKTWRNMLYRCYSKAPSNRTHQPTYADCYVCDEWLTFSNFWRWMSEQPYNGNELDKDILRVGNRVYCPEFCVFVPNQINMFVVDCKGNRGKYTLGVSWEKSRGKFRATCSNPTTNKQVIIGRYDKEIDAHMAWRKTKLMFAKELCKTHNIRDDVKNAILDRYKLDTK